MFRIKILSFFIPFIFFGCQSNTVEKSSDSVSQKKPVAETPVSAAPAVAESQGGLIQTVNRNATTLFGKYIEFIPSEFHSKVSETVIHMNLIMTNNKAVATGPLTFVYPKLPASGKQKIFVGQPVKSVFPVEKGFGFIQTPAGEFYKYQCNAEGGQTLADHQKAQQMLKDKNLEFKTPVIEIFSETRNNEMTVVSKASLLYPKK